MSKDNLLQEGISGEQIIVTGNTVIDALYMVVEKIKNDGILSCELEKVLKASGYDISRLSDGRKLVLITGHRRENFGDGFISMCKAIKSLSEKYPEVDFVYPMHLNLMYANRFMKSSEKARGQICFYRTVGIFEFCLSDGEVCYCLD